MTATRTPAVAMRGITQRFGSVAALDEVDLEVAPGDLHAIVGENGAGKTTLMRVLYGALVPDAGRLEVNGVERRFRRTDDALAVGIGMVSQHYAIIPELTCLENLVLGAEGGPVRNPRDDAERAAALAERMGFAFDWHASAASLSPAAAQKLEILKLLWREARIMILDEPTAMLSPEDGRALFESLHRLASEGATVLLVTHRLPEVLDHCRRVTVLRGGRRVANLEVAATDARELATLIVGAAPPEAMPPVARPSGEPLLRIRDLSAGDARGQTLFGVDLDLPRGRIVGIAGVDGNGQRELVQVLAGVRRPYNGTLTFEERDFGALSPRRRIDLGLRLIAEDRLAEAVVADWSLRENAILGLQKRSQFQSGGRLRPAEVAAWAQRVAEAFGTRHGGFDQPIGSLSGGNQQRFVAGRALESEPRLLIAFQPARGLDLRGTADVYAGMRRAADAGAAVLVISFDLDELLDHCDEIVALSRGRLRWPTPGNERDREAIGRLMVEAR